MEYRLAGAAAVVQNCAIAGCQFALLRKFRSDELQLAEHGCVLLSGLCQRHDMFPRADEDVARRLRLNILEGKNIRILVDEFRRDFLASDFAEQAVIHEGHPEFRVYSRESRVK